MNNTRPATVISFPLRKPAAEGALVGPGSCRVPCPSCKAWLHPFRGYWTAGKFYEKWWLCSGCGETFGPPPLPELGAVDLRTGGAPGENVWRIGLASTEFPFGYEAWVSDDGIVRITDGKLKHRNLDCAVALTPDQARKFGQDLEALARAAEDQRARLRGDDRWHVRPHPERAGVFVARRHYQGNRYTERLFVQTEIRKARRCDVCSKQIEAGAVMYREENPVAWANPNWRDVRICSSCIRGQST
jgi:hypothetical protein